MKFRFRIPSLDLRLIVSMTGLLAQVAAWMCGIIAVFFLASKMPLLFRRIPPEIQFACELLVVLAAVLLFRLMTERRRTLRALAQLSDALARFRPGSRQDRIFGVSPEKMDRIRDSCESLTGTPGDWWQAVDESLEYYEPPDDEGGWFLTRPVRELLPDEELVEPFYHASFHQAVPGILTALGLLATFSAILVALSGVSYNAANTGQPVTGIDSLINGLAGKFLSSIIALILSMVFTFVEKKICERRIYREVDALRSLVGWIFPFLSQTRILLDLQRLALESRPRASETVQEPVEPVAEIVPVPQPEAPAELPPTPAEVPPVSNPEEANPLAAQFGL